MSIGFLIAFFVGILILINATTQISFVQKRYLDGARNLGSIVREVSLQNIVDGRIAELDIIYEEWSNQPNVLALEYIDESNLLLVTGASEGGSQFLAMISDPLVDQARNSRTDIIVEHPEFIVMAFPVAIGTRYLGTIRLRYARRVMNEEVKVVVSKNVQLGAIFTLAGLFLSTWLASSLTAPLRRLDTASKLAAEGDLSQRISIKSSDEVGSLARSFNVMLDKLCERVDALEATKTQLSESKLELERRNTLLQRSVREAEDAKNKAETAEAAKSNFVARMSHEIRTPLNGVLGMTDLLDETELSAEQMDLLSTIRASGDSLLTVVNDILDVSKIASGHMTLRSERFDLTDLVDSTLQTFAASARVPGLELLSCISSDIPPALVGDPIRLKQVLTNLVGNALKFTDIGYVQLSVCREQSGLDGDQLRFDISDSGCGIQPDMMDTLFDEFTQADETLSRAHQGTGLGLAISRGFVELMGGQIWVRSEVGAGTVFSFSIPLVEARGGPMEKAVSVPDLKEKKIAIVMKSPFAASALYNQLTNWNACVSSADSSRTAGITEVDGDPASAIIIDRPLIQAHLKEIRNWRARRQDGQNPTVIALAEPGAPAASAGPADQIADVTLFKPVSARKLAQAVSDGEVDLAKRRLDASPTEQQPPGVKKVLLVDDNATNRKVVELLLKRQGISYQTAIDGQSAVDCFSKFRPDIILMDVSMPVMNGYEATRAIRSIEQQNGYRPCQIIGLTAHTSSGDQKACLDAGMDRHIAKPIKLDVLRHVIKAKDTGALTTDLAES